jgi:MFS transporter, OFA family, oxalate/formate antiporter
MKGTARGWSVVLAGVGINLALGVLYTWSIVAKALTTPAADGGKYLWTAQQANWPYAFAVGCFALMMVAAGRLQDRFGPRWVATAGGLLVGAGMIVASLSPVTMASQTAFPWMMVLGFGVLTGGGIGLAYAAATPAAVKWFPAHRKGLIAGMVVGGFGLASVYTAPLTTYLLKAYSVDGAFLYLGIGFLVAIVLLAQVLTDPPAGYVCETPVDEKRGAAASSAPKPCREYSWREMVRTPSFYVLWLMYAFAAFAGLMIVGIMAKVAVVQLGKETAATLSYVLVATLAIGNFAGRPLSGMISDRIGRKATMLGVFTFQAVMMLVLGFVGTVPLLLVVAALIGFNYGANLALFPATTYDYFGTKNGGVNYGLVFTAWGVGGVFGSQVAAAIFDASKTVANPAGSYELAYVIAAVMCLAAAALTFVAKAPRENEAALSSTRPASAHGERVPATS